MPAITATLLLFLAAEDLTNTMRIIERFKRLLTGFTVKEKEAAAAYNLWAAAYDDQPNNLMLALDEEVFTELLSFTDITNGVITDIGCGTGRHWQKLLQRQPKKLVGFDVSEQMLVKLKEKFKTAETHLLKSNRLEPLAGNSCSLLISTLTIAHIENAGEALTEWARVTAPGGYIIITDYHPAALAKGARRTFTQDNTVISIKNYVHSIDALTAKAKQLNLSVIRLTEKVIDDSMKPYYEKQHAAEVFNKWKGTPVIYGLLLKKADVAV